jgi:hypothetical protein
MLIPHSPQLSVMSRSGGNYSIGHGSCVLLSNQLLPLPSEVVDTSLHWTRHPSALAVSKKLRAGIEESGSVQRLPSSLTTE